MLERESTEVKTPERGPSKSLFDNLIWLSAKEAAAYLRTSVGQIRNMVYRGQLKAYKPYGRLLFSRRELDSFIENSFIEQGSFL